MELTELVSFAALRQNGNTKKVAKKYARRFFTAYSFTSQTTPAGNINLPPAGTIFSPRTT
jgi:hypothetical protein